MRDDDQSRRKGCENFYGVFAGFEIEVVGDLVQDEQLRGPGRDLRQGQAGPLAARKPAHLGMDFFIFPEQEVIEMPAHLRVRPIRNQFSECHKVSRQVLRSSGSCVTAISVPA